jgi:hypothetical protein
LPKVASDVYDDFISSCLDEGTIVVLELELLKESLGIRESSQAAETISRLGQRIGRMGDRLKELRKILNSQETVSAISPED